ncbi:Zn-ribbon domain-containing OB-fold protein [Rhodococcus gannanensis]|uniref:Zn-ribbon domain-containing OB-fold protein n=1 Tax=Rhodococcus gannanensis TaxID=1960308 RepID=A0ABW4PB40_9NOCA
MSVDFGTLPLRTGGFMLRSCACCATLFAPETWVCRDCDGGLDWVPATGRGTVVSWTRLDPASSGGGDKDLAPLTIAIVELDEGPWIYASIESCGAEPRGARVVFEREPLVGRFPVFALS